MSKYPTCRDRMQNPECELLSPISCTNSPSHTNIFMLLNTVMLPGCLRMFVKVSIGLVGNVV